MIEHGKVYVCAGCRVPAPLMFRIDGDRTMCPDCVKDCIRELEAEVVAAGERYRRALDVCARRMSARDATIERVRVRLDDIEEEWGPGMGRPPVIAVIRAELDIPTTEGSDA